MAPPTLFLVLLVLWPGSCLGDSRARQESRSDRGLWDEMRKTNEKTSAMKSDIAEGVYSDNPLNRFILNRRSNVDESLHVSSRRSDDGDDGGGGGGFWSQISSSKNKGKKDDDNVEEETPPPLME